MATAIVIFYDDSDLPNSLTEISRTEEMPYWEALVIYAETPNPASQIVSWETEEQKQEELKKHQEDITNPEWLKDLLSCI